MRSILLVVALSLAGCAPVPTLYGVPRLEQVDVERNVWRSAQPETPEQWATVARLGVLRDVVVRQPGEWPGDPHDAQAAALGITVIEIPMPPGTVWQLFQAPRDEDVERAVSAMELGNALLHCLHGVDRTGYTTMRYKVERLGWDRATAWNEALDRGYRVILLGLTGAALDFLDEPAPCSDSTSSTRPAGSAMSGAESPLSW